MDEYNFSNNNENAAPQYGQQGAQYQQNYGQTPPQGTYNQAVPPYGQAPYYGQGYGQPYFSPAPVEPQPVTMGEWIITSLLMAIPIANIVLLFVWAFGSDTKPSKKNWAKATLIMMAIGVGLAILFGIIMLAAGVSMMDSFRNY